MFSLGATYSETQTIKRDLEILKKDIHRSHRVLRSTSRYYSVGCKKNDCQFALRFNRRSDGMYHLTTCRKHTCQVSDKINSSKLLIKSSIQNVENLRPKECMNYLREEHGLESNYFTVWKSLKELKSEKDPNNMLSSFGKLEEFLTWNYENNPGTITDIVRSECDEVECVYICLNVSRNIFKCSLPLIGLDKTLLVGRTDYLILSAVCIDCERNKFPIAMAVVASECEVSWNYFLNHLQRSLDLSTIPNLVIFTDVIKGLSTCLSAYLPNAKIVRGKDYTVHLGDNNRGNLTEMMRMDIKQEDGNLQTLGPVVDISEKLKTTLRETHPFKSIYKFVNYTGQLACDRFQEYSKITMDYCTSFKSRLERLMGIASDLSVYGTVEDSVYRVERSVSSDLYRIVNLKEKSCSCNPDTQCGLCEHILAAVKFSNRLVDDFIPNNHKIDYVREMYSTNFKFCDLECIKETNLVARNFQNKRGRPKKSQNTE